MTAYGYDLDSRRIVATWRTPMTGPHDEPTFPTVITRAATIPGPTDAATGHGIALAMTDISDRIWSGYANPEAATDPDMTEALITTLLEQLETPQLRKAIGAEIAVEKDAAAAAAGDNFDGARAQQAMLLTRIGMVPTPVALATAVETLIRAQIADTRLGYRPHGIDATLSCYASAHLLDRLHRYMGANDGPEIIRVADLVDAAHFSGLVADAAFVGQVTDMILAIGPQAAIDTLLAERIAQQTSLTAGLLTGPHETGISWVLANDLWDMLAVTVPFLVEELIDISDDLDDDAYAERREQDILHVWEDLLHMLESPVTSS